jgi:hypothetical protein
MVEEGVRVVVALVEPKDFAAQCGWSKGFASAYEILSEAGVKIRVINSLATGLTGLMDRRSDTPAIPSGSTDWDMRYINLGKFMEVQGKSGEVIAKVGQDGTHEKFVRAVGSPLNPANGAIEEAATTGAPIEGCTLYVPSVPSLERLELINGAGIKRVVVNQPRDFEFDRFIKYAPIKIETIWKAPVMELKRYCRSGIPSPTSVLSF